MSGNFLGVLWGASLLLCSSQKYIKQYIYFLMLTEMSKGPASTKIRYHNFTVYKLFWGEAQYLLSPPKSS